MNLGFTVAEAEASLPVPEPIESDGVEKGQESYHPEDDFNIDRLDTDPTTDKVESPTLDPSPYIAIKLLVSNNLAGTIIGPGGQTISAIKEESLARINVGQTKDFYPGTFDRVCFVRGPMDHVEKATELILEKIYEQLRHYSRQRDNDNDESGEESSHSSSESYDIPFTMRLLVPAAACGMFIGPGGAKIKAMAETCGVSMRVSPMDTKLARKRTTATPVQIAATLERIVTIMAQDYPSCVKCVHLMLNEIMENPRVCRYVNMSTSYTKITGGSLVPVISRNGSNSVIQTATDQMEQMQSQDPTGTNDIGLERTSVSSEVQLAIPDKNIGALLGKGGQTISHLRMNSDTEIKISPKGEFIPGTKDRIVTITGPDCEVVAASLSMYQ